MPTASITSTKTGQTFEVDFTNQPTADDIDEVTSAWETQFYQREGLDPSIAEQGPVGTVANQVRNVGPGLVGGLMAQGGRVLDAGAKLVEQGLTSVFGANDFTRSGGGFQDVANVGDNLIQAGQELRPTNPANPIANTIGSGLQQGIGLVATMGAAAPFVGTKTALTTVPLVTGGIMGGGEGVQTARDLGIESPAGQLATGAAFAGAEILTERLGGVGNKAATEALQAGLKSGLKQAGKTMLGEAAEEPLAGAAQDAVTRLAGEFVADPNRPGYTVTGMKLPALDAEFMQRRKMEAIGGAAGGAVFGGVQLAASGRPAAAAPAPSTRVPEMPVAEDLGELTAEDVADLEQQDLETERRGDPERLTPILGNVPDAVMQPAPLNTPAAAPEFNAAANIQQPVTVPDVQSGLSDPGVAEGDVTQGLPVAAAAVTSPDARVPAADETSGLAGVQPAGLAVLQKLNEELPEAARAKWTPQVYAKAGRFLESGNETELEGLTSIQKRRVMMARLEVDPVARAEQEKADKKAEHKLRSQEKKDAAFEQKTTFKNLTIDRDLEAGFMSTAGVDALFDLANAAISAGKTFVQWSAEMVQRFGEAVRSALRGAWEGALKLLPTDAAKNVRLGTAKKSAPVRLAQGGFVMGPGEVKETKSRFARPDEQERLYEVREDVVVKATAQAWVDSLPMEQAVAAMEAGRLPASMTGDVAQHAAGLLIQRTTEMMKSGSEVVQMQARSLGHRISKVWQGWLSQEAGRNLRQRSVVNSELTPYAPILAAEGMLIDRADAVMDKRYEGGAEGAATKVNETADKAGGEASTELAQDLEAETPVPGESSVAREMREARKARAVKKHPSLKRMLDALRKKMYPGMKWADIFMELPASQKERQREIYRRLMLDERLKDLTKTERLALTNELDKAWQQERRKVFLRELGRVGIGEKAAADKAKVVKALPKLIRLINLGMMNSEMFREAIAPEYGLKQITTGQALTLRKLAEEAYALPEGVLRSRKLAELLDGIQKSTGTGLPEVLNQYWVAAVLSGMRTQFDTFMSLTNGFGNQLIQSGMLAIKNGNRAAAMVSMLEWWRALKQAFPEAMQILAKGDYSYLKRFNDDLKKALEGETTFRPVPLGEALWRDGNAMEKYGFAPVMIWTGRLMAAADHLNNSATTAGAKVVARALHPELYKTVAASQSERDAAAAQARREVTGGAMPATAQERATVAARTREILNGQLRPEERAEAAFMGDQAAYQNDPVGVFGAIYRAVNQGLGSLERGLQAYADEKGTDGPAGRYARGLMLFLSGAMRSMMGAKFIRFGANFGNDMLGFVPGTALVSPALLGKEATRSQQQLLMGKNVFGLMAGLTVAAMFLGKDDEEEGWHLEGPWTDLTPEEIKQRRAAGFEPLTFWKRTADKVQRVSYKQWPTAGLLAGVAHMQDRQRFRPEKWAAEGMAGHLLAAASVGAFQVKDVSAMRGLADLLGASKFGTNPEEAFVEKLGKMPVNFVGGFIPTLVKDLDALADPQRYKPQTVLEEFLRNVPVVRRSVAGGRPEINILGVPIEQDRKPWSRAYTEAENGIAHVRLAKLIGRGFTLPTPETNRKVWKADGWTTIAALGADTEWRYQKTVGDGYREWLGSPEAAELLKNPDGLAVQRVINRQADAIKIRAAAKVVK